MNPCCEAKVLQLYKTIDEKNKHLEELQDLNNQLRFKIDFQQQRINHLNDNLRGRTETLCGHDRYSIMEMESYLKRLREQIKADKNPPISPWPIVACVLLCLNVIQFLL
ncbi:hypothetical protein [Vibrio phage JSF28]|jgi:hypothetical protein|uniref:Uncharacterized protein n=8 Tax=Chatterjeevirus ICP3 TaxID=2733612 RepID=A0A2D0Z4T3_9CAUD|nr:hypothetical protein [Vibrio phage JSF25]ASV42892.1 hypothetical protein [Vibrio phage JSF28]ASV42945.1 hypothetical protein [Vibrio phage JSF31]ASV43018.1 hypothetical protein [Vibrio phage JSF32]ASV43088.1 hypothetical protein [Vibrio phage JSF35]ASV43149.1 hypothetical protein [Vibrio phage JSF36]ASV43220.1 hypothetical protein [Vibrio phage JSF18]QIW90082.1 hypothetical protein JSF37_00018 [Vibrio phage JSF37]